MSSINQVDVAIKSSSPHVPGPAVESGKNLPSEAITVFKSQGSGKNSPQNTVVNNPRGIDKNGTDANDSMEKSVAQAVTKLNDYVQQIQRDLEFTVDEQAGVSVVKVINRHSQELIRQMPSQLALDLARKLNDQEPVNLFSARV